jgi:hypothetical protein
MSQELRLDFLRYQSKQLSRFSIERVEIAHSALYQELFAEQKVRSF